MTYNTACYDKPLIGAGKRRAKSNDAREGI